MLNLYRPAMKEDKNATGFGAQLLVQYAIDN